jgi:hypothetical protein
VAGGQPGGAPATSGATGGQPGGAGGGGQPAGSVAGGQPGGAPAGGQAADPAQGGQPAIASGAGSAAPRRGGQPQDPDEPQGPNLSAGVLPGRERPESSRPPRTLRLIGNRDWVIPVECRPDGVVLRASGQKFALAALGGQAGAENPLLRAFQQTIARRQASVRPGEPPYRPQARLLVYPDGLRTYYLACSLLEPLGIPLTRQNVEADAPARPLP